MRNVGCKEKMEFAFLMAQHARGITIGDVQRLLRYGATLGRIAENQCNGYHSVLAGVPGAGQWDSAAAERDEHRQERIRWKVGEICERIGAQAVFQGDPRGNVLKIAVSDGFTNDWGREGICVPTS